MKKIFNSIIILISTILLSNSIFAQQDFFLNDWEPKSIVSPQDFIELEKSSNQTNVNVVINFGTTINKVSNYNFGNNANIYRTKMWNNLGLVQNLRNLNPKVLRYPGGNLSNEFFWNLAPGNRPDDVPPGIYVRYGNYESDTTMSVDSYYKFLDAVGSTGIISVNYGYARYGTSENPISQAAHLAAAWVRYDNGRTKYWEIGNENYGDWQSGYEIDQSLNRDGQPQFISGELYAEHALIFVDSMNAAAAEIGHDIFIGFQVWEEENSWDPIQTEWNEKMMPIVGNTPDFYIIHNYFTPYNENSSAEVILDSYKRVVDFKESVYNDLAEAGLGPKPIALTEYNIFAVGSQQQVSHINGLHASLVVGNVIKENYGLTARWDLANNWDDGNDHGMFSFNEPNVEQFTPYPVFYHMTYFQRYFGDQMVHAVSTNKDIIVYASLFSSGHAGVTIINKGSLEKTVELLTSGYYKGERYYWYELKDEKGDGSFSKKVFINGEGPSQISGGPDNYNSILPFSVMYEGNVKIDIAPYSAIYMMMEGSTIVNVDEKGSENIVNKFELNQNYPNPFNPSTVINYQLKSQSKVELNVYNMLGQKIVELVNEEQAAGNYNVNFDPSSIDLQISSGVYLYRINVSNSKVNFSDSKKMTFIK